VSHRFVPRFLSCVLKDDAGPPNSGQLPLFQPLRSSGLTDDIVEGTADYLNGKTDKDMRSNKLVRVFQDLGPLVVGHKG
jgi:hypothetical protein